jgi:acyl-CoA synthetase (AMP-forming)/AMP-acid ligase II
VPSIYEAIRSYADATPEKLALISERDGERRYAELADDAARLGHAFGSELGLAVGERVCIWMWNRPEWVEASVAASAAGCPIVPLNPEWSDDEVAFVLAHAHVRAIVCEAEQAERALSLCGRCPELRHVLVVGSQPPAGAHSFSELIYAAPANAASRLREIPDWVPGQLMYTSGTTTGRPKAVSMRREQIVSGIDYQEMYGASARDRSIFVTPLFHGNAAGGLSSALIYGGSAVFQRRFSARRFWALVDRTRPTFLFTLAPIVHILMGLPPSPMDKTHSLRVIIALGSGASAPLMEERYGVPVIDWYGMTEAGSGTYTRLGEERRPGSAGRPFGGSSICALREDGTKAAPGEVGEICFRAEAVGFAGYVEDPEATRAALRNGWFHTGDLGYFDRDGYFYFVDRLKDIVRRAGENISSMEVETCLREHPRIADVAIVGKRDPVLGERVIAFAVPVEEGAEVPTPAELRVFAKGRLADYKLPEEVIAIAELPRTATGKIEKFRLRKLLA